MPRRSILSAAERDSLLVLPDAKDELIQHYTFNETDLSIGRRLTCPQASNGRFTRTACSRLPVRVVR